MVLNQPMTETVELTRQLHLTQDKTPLIEMFI